MIQSDSTASSYSQYDELKCLACKASTSIGPLLNQRVYYRIEGEFELPIKVAIGWCHSCIHFTAQEKLPERQLTAMLISQAKTAYDAHGATLSLLQLMIWRHLPVAIHTAKMKELTAREELLNHLTVKHHWISNRQSPPRCLCCGGTDIESIDLQELKQHHRGCSGTLTIEPTGTHLMHRRERTPPPPIIYDSEGLKIMVDKP